ncbi:MAG: sulfite oxidase [Planctomycetes bacterium]|nr:sulfite oxidase [Planctomycetota bacterium]
MAVHQKVLSTTPENRETPLADVPSWVTPNRWFFVRSHYETPEIDVAQWRLKVAGAFQRELELTWEQLDSLPHRSIFVTMECAGNGRSFLKPYVEGVQWTAGAVGHAEWSGVPLHVVLERASLAAAAVEVVFYGSDSGVEHGHGEPTAFARSLPLDKALHADTLLVTHMNGEMLEPSHGYPLRLIVPGWYGVASVKWLTRIEAVTTPFRGYYQTAKYTIKHRTGGGVRTDVVGPMPVKSEIIRPIDGSVLGIGANRLFGMAWAGEHAVAAVEVSVDGGLSWQRAELQGPRAAYSWTAWEYLWETAAPGEYTLLARAISADGHVQPMNHDFDRGGYLINFSRPINVRLDASRLSQDFVGDVAKLQREMAAVARERSRQPLDADIEFMSGAGI